MNGRRMGRMAVAALAVAAMAGAAGAAEPCFAGLRRSSYGLKDRNSDDAWWAERARLLARRVSTPTRPVTPMIVQIVGIYLDSGACRLEFAPPGGTPSDPPGVEFKPGGRVDHGKALDVYARQGVKAILQIEPGKADVGEALRIVHRAFGRHPAVVGYGVDAEWYRTSESPDKSGMPVTDRDAEDWMLVLESFGPVPTLFLKHWDPKHMPPSYRHPRLWFLDDSQGFDNADSMLKDFRKWSDAFRKQPVGFQIGYPKDEYWWQKLGDAPTDLGLRILRGVPNTRYVFWVDFTADRIPAERGAARP